jgi:hypothetical protein
MNRTRRAMLVWPIAGLTLLGAFRWPTPKPTPTPTPKPTTTPIPTPTPTVGPIIAPDHGAGSIDEVVNVCYGTGAPPAANTTTEGTLYFQYTG